MLRPYVFGRRLSDPVETLPERMAQALKGARSLADQEKRLNEFKDRQIFFIDLDHILDPRAGLQALSRGLTVLAEAVVSAASGFVCADVVRRFGSPKTVAGLDAKYAILGLGKLGGASLGYASDIELLFVYSDNGRTEGSNPIENAEFYDRLVKGVARFITAKREGIFHVDLRLRPYGNAGPLACSLESFCRYYAPEGQAHSYERIALVCLRAIGGDRDLGNRLERLRDEMIYFGGPLDLRELLDLRERQFKEKTEGGRLNAKFSPGGLVDIEYGVQILQVTYGKDFPQLRTPHINKALAALHGAGVLSEEETRRLSEAYRFLRHLINGMRMLRGSARDLFLPSVESDEYAHLARRMGYQRGGPLDPQEQLRIDFEKHTALVRLFAERHFGRDSLPGPGVGTVADLILGDRLPPQRGREILAHAGFRDPERAYTNMKGLAGEGIRRERFAELALLALDILKTKADPDMALNNWERFIHALGSPEFHYSVLLSQPMRLEILLGLFAGSQFLADTLIRNPGFLDWVVMPENLHKPRHREEIEEEGRRLFQGSGSHREWLNRLRRLRRREILRIGTRDICLQVPLREIVFDLSALAEALIQVVLEEIFDRLEKEKTSARDKNLRDRFCIAAFGKLGGNELNYSSDIDLLGLWDDGGASRDPGRGDCQDYKALFSQVMEDVTSDLSIHTEEGRAYRVDLRLRPFGREGELAPSLSVLIDYYRCKASLWEIQAALKIRPVAGNLKLGYAFLKEMRPLWLRDRNRSSVVQGIERMRHEGIKAASTGTVDVKSGLGGLRDVEFLVQGLQLIHAPKRPELLEGNTMMAIDLLHEAGILPETAALPLKEDYAFLRRVEHCLQLLDDRQVHVIPSDQNQLDALAKRMLGIRGEAEGLMERLTACRGRIRNAYGDYLLEGNG